MHPNEHRLLRTPEAAALLGLSTSTLNKMRCTGRGPQFIKISAAAVGYEPAAIEAYKAARRRSSTSDPGQQAA